MSIGSSIKSSRRSMPKNKKVWIVRDMSDLERDPIIFNGTKKESQIWKELAELNHTTVKDVKDKYDVVDEDVL